MATLEQLSAALVKADAAGNAEDARALANEIRKMKGAPQAAAPEAAEPVGVVDKTLGALDSFGKWHQQYMKDTAAGMARGAGSIGATILAPIDMATDAIKGDRKPGLTGLVTGVQPISRNQERRQAMDSANRGLGANPDSVAYGAGKLGAEIAGTAGVGGVLAKPLQALAASRYGIGIEPILNGLATSLQTGGFRTGELAGTGAVNALARVVGGAATGGASAGLVDPSTAGTGALIGGVLPAATQVAGKVGSAVSSVARKALPKASEEVATLANRAKELGIDIPADRLVSSKPLDAVASGLRYTPFSGRAASEAKMEGQLDRALTRTFGQNSENVTQALRKAGDELGGKFDSVLKSNTVNIDKQFLTELSDVVNTASKELGTDALRPIANQVDEIIAKGANGAIDGQAAYNIKRTLDRLGRGNGPEAFHALELKRSLMGALDRSLGPDAAAAFATTRKQYGNMLALEKLAANGAEGGISAARLGNMKNINNPELQELADIAAQFVKQRESAHGAAQRAAVGVATGFVGGLPGLAAGAGLGRGANTMLNSNSLRNALLNQGGKAVTQEDVNLLTRLTSRAAPLLPAQ
jgi:hypothetical protein